MREFFGFGGYERTPEGAYSWQHLTFVGLVLLAMFLLALFLGLNNRGKSEKKKNLVLIWSAILIDSIELFKIVLLCFRSHDPMNWRLNLPLFLCSIQLITIPLAAFSKGKVREASLDFVLLFGILGAVFGTIGAAQNYGAYPVLSFDNVVSAVTHAISGFASLYIAFSKMASLKEKNIWITCGIIVVVSIVAYIANLIIPYNYMFLMRDDGTPYSIFFNLVNGNKVLYPMIVVGLFIIYIFVFYGIVHLVRSKKKHKNV